MLLIWHNLTILYSQHDAKSARKQYRTNVKVISAVEDFFEDREESFYTTGIHKKCVDHRGDYCISHIFRESNFSQIGTSRHFREWLNLRSRRRAMDGEISIIHSFARALCTVLLHVVLRTQVTFPGSHSCVGIGGKFFACC